ncbi:MAG: TetR/AcrR family transcriptional regulator C-terminal domain-containing protein [Clostridiales bacterium]
MPSSYITKRLMAMSLKQLMEKKPLNKISIQSIVGSCGLTRQAFYYHFKDVYELLGWIYNNEAIEYLKNNVSYDSWKDAYLEFLRYILKNKVFCMNTLKSLGRKQIEQFLYENTSRYFNKIIDELSADMKVKEENKLFISRFYTPAFVALAINWMENNMEVAPEKILNDVSVIMDGNILKSLERFKK